MNKPNKIVEVIWLDSGTEQGWSDAEDILREAEDGLVCSSVGYLICETDKTITIAQGLGFDSPGKVGEIGEATTIIRASVVEIRELVSP